MAAGVAGLLGTGLLSTVLYTTAQAPTLAQGVRFDGAGAVVTRDEADAARWLADHSAPADVFAPNRVCTQSQPGPSLPQPCTAKAFAMAALSGRDAYVGGWAYADRNLDSAWQAMQWWSAQPFWDPDRLNAQMRAFTQPTAGALAVLRARGVRWLVADDRGVRVDIDTLDQLATRRYSSATVQVWQLR